MLTPDYLSGAPSGLVDLFAELEEFVIRDIARSCLLYTSPSPRD